MDRLALCAIRASYVQTQNWSELTMPPSSQQTSCDAFNVHREVSITTAQSVHSQKLVLPTEIRSLARKALND